MKAINISMVGIWIRTIDYIQTDFVARPASMKECVEMHKNGVYEIAGFELGMKKTVEQSIGRNRKMTKAEYKQLSHSYRFWLHRQFSEQIYIGMRE